MTVEQMVSMLAKGLVDMKASLLVGQRGLPKAIEKVVLLEL